MLGTTGEGAARFQQRQQCRDFQLVQQQPHMNSRNNPEKPAAAARLPPASPSPPEVGKACWCSVRAAGGGQVAILRGEEPIDRTSSQATERRARAGAGGAAGEGGAAVAAARAPAVVSGAAPALLPRLSSRWTARFGAGSPGFQRWTRGRRRSSRGRSTAPSFPASRSERGCLKIFVDKRRERNPTPGNQTIVLLFLSCSLCKVRDYDENFE